MSETVTSSTSIASLPPEVFSDIITYLGRLEGFTEWQPEKGGLKDDNPDNDIYVVESDEAESDEESDEESNPDLDEDYNDYSDEESDYYDYEARSKNEPKPALYALAPYSSVSWQFRYAVERLTFRSLTIKSPSLAHFERLMRETTRRMSLRSLSIKIFLPDYPTRLPHNTISKQSARDDWDNRKFTLIVQHILRILSEWSVDTDMELRILRVTSLIFKSTEGEYRVKHYRGRRPAPLSLIDEPLSSGPAPLSLIDKPLSSGPYIGFITSFKLTSEFDSYREVEAASAFRIALNFPNLEKLFIKVPDRRYPQTDLRCSRRQKLAEEISRLPHTLKKLKSLLFSFNCPDPKDHFFKPASVLDSTAHDPVGTAIRKLYSSSLKRIVLSGPLTMSTDFFINKSARRGALFSNLTVLEITFSLVDAAGDWLLEPDSGPDSKYSQDHEQYSDTEEERLDIEYKTSVGASPCRESRSLRLPVWGKWAALMKRMAYMTRVMPALKDFILECLGAKEGMLIFYYLAPGTPSRLFIENPSYLQQRRLYCVKQCLQITRKFRKKWNHKTDSKIVVIPREGWSYGV